MSIVRKIISPLYKAYMYIFGSRIMSHKLRNLAESCGNDIGKLVNLTFSFEYKQVFHKSRALRIRPYQIISEITALLQIVQESKPKVIVEIGTYSGGTLFLFDRIANPEKIISIDLPEGPFGGGYPFWMVPFFKSLGRKPGIQLIRADSHCEETLGKLKTLLKGGEVDFLFIDGDHTYPGVKQDFYMYSPLVRKGGIVALHDIVIHDPKTGCEVDRFWNEVKLGHRNVEIVEKLDQKSAGIGVLYF
jgi:predicted O-methyltransferase YrrM